ncbi:MAG: hypothetical protein JW723_12270 [Bacteroidales bacterium]|nr:hypothetical protein [Bacteroidales bacterium]
MKKIYFYFLFFILCIAPVKLFGQDININKKLIVTPLGLRDASDNEKTFVVILTDGMTAKQLYSKSVKYINQNYKNPEEVIKGNIEGEYLKWNTFVSNFLLATNSGAKVLFDAKYTTELYFKDDKFKYEIVSLEIYTQQGHYPIVYVGGMMEWAIYNKKGELKREDVKEQIETYFNSEIYKITEFLKDNYKKNDW